jgi:hypothetical protein
VANDGDTTTDTAGEGVAGDAKTCESWCSDECSQLNRETVGLECSGCGEEMKCNPMSASWPDTGEGEGAATEGETFWFKPGDPKLFEDQKRKWHYLLFVDKTASWFPTLQKAFRKVSTKNQDKLIHIFVGSETKMDRSVQKLFGVKRRKLPLAMIANSNEVNELYKYKGLEYSAEKLTEFSENWRLGKLKKTKTDKHTHHKAEKKKGDSIEINDAKWDA